MFEVGNDAGDFELPVPDFRVPLFLKCLLGKLGGLERDESKMLILLFGVIPWVVDVEDVVLLEQSEDALLRD